MNDLKKCPACTTPVFCTVLGSCTQTPSEGATPEPAGPSGALRCDGSGSLPLSSAKALLKRWDEAAAGYRKGGETSNVVANAFEICASDLRRQMESTNERQPEENGKLCRPADSEARAQGKESNEN